METTEIEMLPLRPEVLAALQARARRARSEYVFCLMKRFADFVLAPRDRRAGNALRTAPCA